ncbi:hypothetical protein ACN47E_002022 [Coniothyrium glycines]
MAGNRRERRARDAQSTASSTGSAFRPSNELDENAVEMILKHPDYSGGPQGKTLFDLADERQRELDLQKPAGWSRGKKPASAAALPTDDEAAIGPIGDAILYSMSMASLHLTLDVIVYDQYREAILWSEILKRAAAALPIFVLLVYITHVELTYRFPLLRNLVFFVGSIAAGCYLIYSGNQHGYFYVMKAAPPVGALWVWSVVEMSLPYAALSVVGVFGYVWYNGFGLF